MNTDINEHFWHLGSRRLIDLVRVSTITPSSRRQKKWSPHQRWCQHRPTSAICWVPPLEPLIRLVHCFRGLRIANWANWTSSIACQTASTFPWHCLLLLLLFFFFLPSVVKRVIVLTAIWTVGHRLRSTPTNGHRCTALSLPWRSPIQVLIGLDVTWLQWPSHRAIALVATADLAADDEYIWQKYQRTICHHARIGQIRLSSTSSQLLLCRTIIISSELGLVLTSTNYIDFTFLAFNRSVIVFSCPVKHLLKTVLVTIYIYDCLQGSFILC